MFSPAATVFHRQEKLFKFNVFKKKNFPLGGQKKAGKTNVTFIQFAWFPWPWMNPLVSAGMFTRITLCFEREEQPSPSKLLPDCLDHQEAYRCAAQT